MTHIETQQGAEYKTDQPSGNVYALRGNRTVPRSGIKSHQGRDTQASPGSCNNPLAWRTLISGEANDFPFNHRLDGGESNLNFN